MSDAVQLPPLELKVNVALTGLRVPITDQLLLAMTAHVVQTYDNGMSLYELHGFKIQAYNNDGMWWVYREGERGHCLQFLDEWIAIAHRVGDEAGRNAGHLKGHQVGYQTGYLGGEQAGLKKGQEEGYRLGYSAGHKEGRQQGDQEGFVRGKQVGQDEGVTAGLLQGNKIGYDKGVADGVVTGRQQALERFTKDVLQMLQKPFMGM